MREFIRIFVLAKADIYMEGVIRILGDHSQMQVVAQVDPSEDYQPRFVEAKPDVLLLQPQMIPRPISGFIKQFKVLLPEVKVLVLGQNMQDTFLNDLVRAGANGYINESMSGKDFLNAVNHIVDGGIWVERRILEHLAVGGLEMEQMIEDMVTKKIQTLSDVLTKRESQVLQLVLKGLATKDIAEQIHLSEQSVKLHLNKLFRKFEVTNRSQLILLAFERVCPVANMVKLFRITLDKRRLEQKKPPLIVDPLV